MGKAIGGLTPQGLIKNKRGVKGRLLRDSNGQIGGLLPAKYVYVPVLTDVFPLKMSDGRIERMKE